MSALKTIDEAVAERLKEIEERNRKAEEAERTRIDQREQARSEFAEAVASQFHSHGVAMDTSALVPHLNCDSSYGNGRYAFCLFLPIEPDAIEGQYVAAMVAMQYHQTLESMMCLPADWVVTRTISPRRDGQPQAEQIHTVDLIEALTFAKTGLR